MSSIRQRTAALFEQNSTRPPTPIVILNSLTIIVITSRIVLQLQNTVLEMAEADEDLPGVTSAASVPVKMICAITVVARLMVSAFMGLVAAGVRAAIIATQP